MWSLIGVLNLCAVSSILPLTSYSGIGFEIKIPEYSRTSQCSLMHIPNCDTHLFGVRCGGALWGVAHERTSVDFALRVDHEPAVGTFQSLLTELYSLSALNNTETLLFSHHQQICSIRTPDLPVYRFLLLWRMASFARRAIFHLVGSVSAQHEVKLVKARWIHIYNSASQPRPPSTLCAALNSLIRLAETKCVNWLVLKFL